MQISSAVHYTVTTVILSQWHLGYVNIKLKNNASRPKAYKSFHGKLKKKTTTET